MERKAFLKKGFFGLGAIVAVPTSLLSCSDDDLDPISGSCVLTPEETPGPFPNLTPAELVRQNIVGGRTGVALAITLTVQDQSNNCQPLVGAAVDIWHCDASGFYSQYGETPVQQEDFRSENFLRGRQATDVRGQVSFISIFPGWYPNRSPHIHLEILSASQESLIISQIAFPKEVCDIVYSTEGYRGEADTLNENDNIFRDSLAGNMIDNIVGNITDGYHLTKVLVV